MLARLTRISEEFNIAVVYSPCFLIVSEYKLTRFASQPRSGKFSFALLSSAVNIILEHRQIQVLRACLLVQPIRNQSVRPFSVHSSLADVLLGGHVLSHASTTRISLRKARGEERIAKLADSPDQPESEASYKIASGGIADV